MSEITFLCELKVFKGAERLLKEYKPYVVSEINVIALKEMGTDQKEIYEYMLSLGYKAYTLPDEEEINLSELPSLSSKLIISPLEFKLSYPGKGIKIGSEF